MPLLRSQTVLVAALGLALVVATPGRAQAPPEQELVDSSYWSGSYPIYQGDRLTLWLKATPQNGKLRLCGAYLAIVTERLFAELQSAMRDINSYISVGAESGTGRAVHPGFLIGRRLGGDAPILRADERPAGCVVTDLDWDDRFARDGFDLVVREARIKAGRRMR